MARHHHFHLDGSPATAATSSSRRRSSGHVHHTRSTATDARGRWVERSPSETTRGGDDTSVYDMDRRITQHYVEIMSKVDPEWHDYLHRTESHSASQSVGDVAGTNKFSAFDGRFELEICGRRLKASAVHVAALHASGGGQGASRLMQLLVESGADLCQPCEWVDLANVDEREDVLRSDLVCFSRPVHLAAAVGGCDALDALQRAGAPITCTCRPAAGGDRGSPVAPCGACDSEGGSPLHEAVQFQRAEAVELLLRLRADPAAANCRGSTPLHLAAQQGSVQIAQLLLGLRGDLPRVDEPTRSRRLRKCRFCEAGLHHDQDANGNKVHETALMLALSSGQFPYDKLFLLAERRLTDILQVARTCPAAASYLMRDPRHGWRGGGVHASWRRGVLEQLHRMRRGNQHLEGAWIELLEKAPPAAEDLLEAVTVMPREECIFT
ncbi:unnamed protein product [Prorocentrum cordatum]|uniref:Uncharacterized protein n=1 Tax=Prorocentrum cordatum TaxID=2364126 RepID=A0ABN9YFC3_9DINO|nr:unnamed protein product [Polarella glacialis]